MKVCFVNLIIFHCLNEIFCLTMEKDNKLKKKKNMKGELLFAKIKKN